MILVFLMVGFVVTVLFVMYRVYMKTIDHEFVCKKCGWRGMESEMKTEIFSRNIMMCYVEKCPNCGEVLDAWNTVDFRI